METRDWEFSVLVYKKYTIYYAQPKSRRMPPEQTLQADLTQSEAMALLSLLGTPQEYRNDSYFVDINN
jgi:hypothetical protein